MTRYLLSVVCIAALAACASNPDSLGDPSGGGDGTGGGSGNTAGGAGGGSGNTGGGTGNGATTGGGGDPTGGGGGGASLPPPPASGPGSADSPAHQYFVASVNPALQPTCGSCHNTGANGAPVMMSTDASISYQNFDSRGLVVDNSLLLTKGAHAGGLAPALTSTQQTLITTWLGMEKVERVGQAAPVNILSKIGACMDKTKFDAIGFQNLKTTPRTNENQNTCGNGCNNAPCRVCHDGGDGGFYMAAGSKLDDQTFPMSQTEQFIVKYIGLNGTTPIASNAIKAKMDAVKTGPAYSHAMFTISATMQTALDAFVTDAVTRYNAKQCGQ